MEATTKIIERVLVNVLAFMREQITEQEFIAALNEIAQSASGTE